jgi:integrase/recombinase XerD
MSKLFKCFDHPHHKLIFSICRFTAERIGAVLQLSPLDVYEGKGRVRTIVNFRGRTRKGSNGKPGETRQVPMHPTLAQMLRDYPVDLKCRWLFPSSRGDGHITFQAADQALKRACDKAGLGSAGISSHSFRRSAITDLSRAGISAKVIQSITGHKKLDQVSRYIDVSDEEKENAIEVL